MKPNYEIIINNQDMTEIIKQHFVSLVVKDSSGLKSDSITLVLADPDNTLVWPQKGESIKVSIGFDDDLHYKGKFILDEPDYSGAPDQLTIVARAADLVGMGSTLKNRAWGNLSLGDIVETLAAEHGLIPAVSDALADISIPSTFQTDESDLNFLARLAQLHGAITQVKNGRLLLVKQGAKVSASGAPLPVAQINKNDCSRFRFSERRSDEFDAVEARYKELITVTYPWWNNYTYSYYTHKTHRRGTGDKLKRLTGTFSSIAEAQAAVDAEYDSISSGASSLNLTLSQGRPELIAEMGSELAGFIQKITDLEWIVTDVTHTLNNGLSTTAKLIRPSGYEKLLTDNNNQ